MVKTVVPFSTRRQSNYCPWKCFRAFSWTTFDEGSSNSLSPGLSSSAIQRNMYSTYIPVSPHINRLSVIKQESLDQSDVFTDYLIQKVDIKAEPECGGLSKKDSQGFSEAVTCYPPAQSFKAFPTPVTPSPMSPVSFPATSKFFPMHFQPKFSSYSWSSSSLLSPTSSSLLSPAPSLHNSSQEELAHCRPWKYEVT